MDHNKTLSYKDAGVDIDAGNNLVSKIKQVVKKTHRPEVIGGLGGFGGLCEIPKKYTHPVLVSGTDGVGTKLRLAIELKKHQTIGIDLVAMCVNDLLVQGAEPLFFLDYYASGKLDINIATDVITGISEGCQESGCALIGGETAEMPGMYQNNDYDIAGFCVGVVEKEKIIDGSKVKPGDAMVALASSGPHSNGYSLIRKILELSNTPLDEPFNDSSIGEVLLTPTKIYIQSMLACLEKFEIHAISHITGGGFWENIPRILPPNTKAVIQESSWQWPEIFNWLQQKGNVQTYEMYKTFNCGVGLVLILPQNLAPEVVQFLNQQGEEAWILGDIQAASSTENQVEMIA